MYNGGAVIFGSAASSSCCFEAPLRQNARLSTPSRRGHCRFGQNRPLKEVKHGLVWRILVHAGLCRVSRVVLGVVRRPERRTQVT